MLKIWVFLILALTAGATVARADIEGGGPETCYNTVEGPIQNCGPTATGCRGEFVTDICSANGGDGSYCNNSYGSCCGTENYTTQYASGTCQNYGASAVSPIDEDLPEEAYYVPDRCNGSYRIFDSQMIALRKRG